MIGTLESGRARQNNRFCALCTPTGFDSLGAIELEKQIRCWVYFSTYCRSLGGIQSHS